MRLSLRLRFHVGIPVHLGDGQSWVVYYFFEVLFVLFFDRHKVHLIEIVFEIWLALVVDETEVFVFLILLVCFFPRGESSDVRLRKYIEFGVDLIEAVVHIENAFLVLQLASGLDLFVTFEGFVLANDGFVYTLEVLLSF